MNQQHERYREIPLTHCEAGCPHKDGGPLRIILFKRDIKLRSHAIKHFTNLAESDATWKAIAQEDRKSVRNAITRLQELGCPYYSVNTYAPPCEAGWGQCPLYDACTTIVARLEEIFLRSVENFVQESGEIPRYACFFSDKQNADLFWAMPDRPVVIKAILIEDDVYNVLTCYGKAGMSFAEMRDLQLEKIRNEARTKNITLCTEANWGGVTADHRNAKLETDGRQGATNRIKSRPKQKYTRQRGGNWRQFLDEYEDF